MVKKLKRLKTYFDKKCGELCLLKKDRDEALKKIECINDELKISLEAQKIIQVAAEETQKKLEYHISNLVSLAQSSIFDDPWKLRLDFVTRRGKIECDFLWEKGDNFTKDISFGGAGGEEDVGALGLQFAMSVLQRPKSRSVIFLDEPLSSLKGGEFPERGAQMIKDISAHQKIQIVMITHIPDQVSCADRVFEVSIKNRISSVKQK